MKGLDCGLGIGERDLWIMYVCVYVCLYEKKKRMGRNRRGARRRVVRRSAEEDEDEIFFYEGRLPNF